MMDVENSTTAHYTKRNLYESIIAALKRTGKLPEAVTAEDLAPVDAFHLRGRTATLELGGLGSFGPEDHVLDVGCGLGGSARHLAQAFGCQVTGLDLTPEYVVAAEKLTALLGLSAQVSFRTANALFMPFENHTFDVVWSEHAQMNIPDKRHLYNEIHRVLKPGGRFLFHDILQGSGGAPHFPVPWASTPDFSALIGPADFRKLLQSLGFDVRHWEDKTVEGRDWFTKLLAALRENGPPPLGFNLLLGPIGMQCQQNTLLNLQENRIAVFQGLLEKMG